MADISSLLGSAGIGGAIGKAIVSLELDTKKYLGEMKAAEGQTAASTNSMATGMSKFGALASTAFAGVGVAAVAFAAVSVKAALEANEAHLKLQNTFANNASLADSSVAAFEAQANALRDLTGVDDEAIIGAQALLGQFHLTGSQVEKLIPLIVDLSAKMGIDLETAAKAVGKATQGNTGALARYGIMIDDTGKGVNNFTATLQGLGVAQGFAADRAKAEPWLVLQAQFEELEETVGQALIPIMQAIVPVLEDLVTVLQFATGATEGFDRAVQDASISLASGELHLAGWIEKMTGHIPFIGQAVEVWDQYRAAQDAASASIGLSADQLDTLNTAITTGDPAVAHFRDQAVGLFEDFLNLSEIAPEVRKRLSHLTDDIPKVAKAFRDTRDALIEEIPAIRGTATTWKETFTLSPNELKKITESWAKIARTIASDLREIADSDLKPRMREAIAALPPEMRHAWVEGNDRQRASIEKSIQTTFSVEDQMPKLAREALTGGTLVGTNMDQGIVRGIESGIPAITSAARNAVEQALAAARRAAQAESPSKVMHRLGVDMMVGLANGISDAEQKAIDAAKKAIENSISSIEDQLSKVQSKASSFRDAIKGGFSSFLDISGAFGLGTEEGGPGGPTGDAISAFIAAQVGGAQQLADVLKALKTQGAGKGLLSQIAGGGTEAIPFAQALLQGGPAAIEKINTSLATISDLASQTGKGLSERFFGEKIDKLEAKLDRIHDDLRELNGYEREGHSHDIIMDDQKVATGVRKELIRTGSRNSDIFGGRA